jgi:protein-export membrane protein SecD
MIYKSIWIVFLILLALAMMFPTIGKKSMEITLSSTTTSEQKEIIRKRFSGNDFKIEEKENLIIVSGRSLNDAVMNETRIFEGVNDARLLKTWSEDKLLAKKINLGLDLQGGMLLVLKANYEKIMQKYISDLKSIDQKLADETKLKSEDRERLKNERKHITETFLDEISREKGEYALQDKYRSEITQQALELLRNRVDKFGVAEPSIRPTGNGGIEIQLPGVRDPNAVKKALAGARALGRKALGSTVSLEYKLVDDGFSARAGQWFKEKQEKEKERFAEGWGEDGRFIDLLLADMSRELAVPENLEVFFYYERDETTKKIRPEYPLVLQKEASVEGTDISEAFVNQDDYGQIVVSFRTTADGAAKFSNATRAENRDRRLAIVLDRKVRNAPRIIEQISSGSGQITGGFSYEEAITLARIIKEGALPVDLQIVEERIVGPSLGQDSINAGIKAGYVAIALVMIFMLIYYKGAGLIANIGIVLNMLFSLALLSMLGFTLTLPGIAGFILTVGMAVDANVIIYERIKEELATGKSVRMAIVYGFDRAFWAIFDSNLTTIIAAFVLFQFGTGPIKGFAVSLFIGLISSMFVVLYITKFVYQLISLNKKLKKLSI